MIDIKGLRGLTLHCTDLNHSSEFYEKIWGLQRLDSGGLSGTYFKGSGREPCILGLEPAESRGVSALRLALDSEAAVDQAYDLLGDTGVARLDEPGSIPVPGDYYGFHCSDPDGNRIELSALSRCAPTETDAPYLPQRLSHLVFNSPDNKAQLRFYTDVLGLQLADWYAGDVFYFLRCNSQHHIFGLERGDNVSLNHVAFHVEDLDAMMRFVGRMSNSGREPLWGPGRHGPGGNCFCYYEDPDGYVVEVTSELIEIPEGEDWVPEEWIPGPDNANVWGTGGRTEKAIKLMSGH